jgi:hypothetical protein
LKASEGTSYVTQLSLLRAKQPLRIDNALQKLVIPTAVTPLWNNATHDRTLSTIFFSLLMINLIGSVSSDY